MSGSTYDTKFWKHAEEITIDDPVFYEFLEEAASKTWFELMNNADTEFKNYAAWPLHSFKRWHEGINCEV